MRRCRDSALLGTVAKPLTTEKLDVLFAKMREAAPARAVDAKMAPEADLTNAFIRQELQLVYQPKIWMRTGKFAGVESLVRWKHPALGLFQPGSFVPLMEGSEELSASLTDFSLRESIACVGRWREAGRELRIAINLSARAFDRLDLPERANAMCLEHHVEPEWITLELTETYVARDAVRMIDVATRLRLKGFTLSIDDFGTGQSGLVKAAKASVQRTQDRPPVRERLLAVDDAALGGRGEPRARAQSQDDLGCRGRAASPRLGSAQPARLRRDAGIFHRAADERGRTRSVGDAVD